jgi:hypothetical protein
MWSFLKELRDARVLRRFRARARDALALNRRWEVREDALGLAEISMKLDMKWRARSIHPWDRDLSEERAAPKFVEQTLSDTEAALERLFARFPEVGLIDFKVLEPAPNSHRAIVAGLVNRKEFVERRSPAIAMRLRSVGINYRLVDSHFEPLSIETAGPQEADDAMSTPAETDRRAHALPDLSGSAALAKARDEGRLKGT